MAGYIFKRILRSILSIVTVVLIIMILVFQLMNKDNIFNNDSGYSRVSGNAKINYKYDKWEDYGYYDVEKYNEFLTNKVKETGEDFNEIYYVYDDSLKINVINRNTNYYKQFVSEYENKGYTIVEANAQYSSDISFTLAYKSRNVFLRLWDFFSNLFYFDNTGYQKISQDYISAHVFVDENDNEYTDSSFLVQKKDGTWDMNRYIKFAKDPINGGFCILGSGTKNRYLLYFDSTFPYIHQNFLTLNLGVRYQNGQDFFSYFISYQGQIVTKETTLPSGNVVNNAHDYHQMQFSENALESDIQNIGDYYTVSKAEYTNGLSMIGYSFVIGIIAVILEYIIGIPLGMLIALKKDSIWDKLGNIYIVFIMAVPSLAYIYMFSSIGSNLFKLPNTWMPVGGAAQIAYFVLPIVSLALPSIASLMKWVRRYTIDQYTADYVKFARAQGYSEGEIFKKHILKNALIPIVQGIPGAVLGALTGAIITEGVYNVPGMGKLLTDAINNYDNGVIVGISFFYAVLSIISMILGDVLLTKIDPRISFAGGGRK